MIGELDNFHEETDPERSHLDIVLRFAEANGADLAAVKAGRGLPTTRSWVAFLKNVAKARPGKGCLAIGIHRRNGLDTHFAAPWTDDDDLQAALDNFIPSAQGLEKELQEILQKLPQWEREQREQLRNFNKEIIGHAIGHLGRWDPFA